MLDRRCARDTLDRARRVGILHADEVVWMDVHPRLFEHACALYGETPPLVRAAGTFTADGQMSVRHIEQRCGDRWVRLDRWAAVEMPWTSGRGGIGPVIALRAPHGGPAGDPNRTPGG